MRVCVGGGVRFAFRSVCDTHIYTYTYTYTHSSSSSSSTRTRIAHRRRGARATQNIIHIVRDDPHERVLVVAVAVAVTSRRTVRSAARVCP